MKEPRQYPVAPEVVEWNQSLTENERAIVEGLESELKIENLGERLERIKSVAVNFETKGERRFWQQSLGKDSPKEISDENVRKATDLIVKDGQYQCWDFYLYTPNREKEFNDLFKVVTHLMLERIGRNEPHENMGFMRHAAINVPNLFVQPVRTEDGLCQFWDSLHPDELKAAITPMITVSTYDGIGNAGAGVYAFLWSSLAVNESFRDILESLDDEVQQMYWENVFDMGFALALTLGRDVRDRYKKDAMSVYFDIWYERHADLPALSDPNSVTSKQIKKILEPSRVPRSLKRRWEKKASPQKRQKYTQARVSEAIETKDGEPLAIIQYSSNRELHTLDKELTVTTDPNKGTLCTLIEKPNEKPGKRGLQMIVVPESSDPQTFKIGAKKTNGIPQQCFVLRADGAYKNFEPVFMNEIIFEIHYELNFETKNLILHGLPPEADYITVELVLDDKITLVLFQRGESYKLDYAGLGLSDEEVVRLSEAGNILINLYQAAPDLAKRVLLPQAPKSQKVDLKTKPLAKKSVPKAPVLTTKPVVAQEALLENNTLALTPPESWMDGFRLHVAVWSRSNNNKLLAPVFYSFGVEDVLDITNLPKSFVAQTVWSDQAGPFVKNTWPEAEASAIKVNRVTETPEEETNTNDKGQEERGTAAEDEAPDDLATSTDEPVCSLETDWETVEIAVSDLSSNNYVVKNNRVVFTVDVAAVQPYIEGGETINEQIVLDITDDEPQLVSFLGQPDYQLQDKACLVDFLDQAKEVKTQQLKAAEKQQKLNRRKKGLEIVRSLGKVPQALQQARDWLEVCEDEDLMIQRQDSSHSLWQVPRGSAVLGPLNAGLKSLGASVEMKADKRNSVLQVVYSGKTVRFDLRSALRPQQMKALSDVDETVIIPHREILAYALGYFLKVSLKASKSKEARLEKLAKQSRNEKASLVNYLNEGCAELINGFDKPVGNQDWDSALESDEKVLVTRAHLRFAQKITGSSISFNQTDYTLLRQVIEEGDDHFLKYLVLRVSNGLQGMKNGKTLENEGANNLARLLIEEASGQTFESLWEAYQAEPEPKESFNQRLRDLKIKSESIWARIIDSWEQDKIPLEVVSARGYSVEALHRFKNISDSK